MFGIGVPNVERLSRDPEANLISKSTFNFLLPMTKRYRIDTFLQVALKRTERYQFRESSVMSFTATLRQCWGDI